MDYLTELGLSNEEISNINPALVESLTLFPLVNPDKLRNIFSKYDKEDLIRCLEKNHKVIEKL